MTRFFRIHVTVYFILPSAASTLMCDRYVWTGSDGGKNAASFPLRLTWLVIRFIAFGSAHVFFQTETTTPVTKPDWIEHSE